MVRKVKAPQEVQPRIASGKACDNVRSGVSGSAARKYSDGDSKEDLDGVNDHTAFVSVTASDNSTGDVIECDGSCHSNDNAADVDCCAKAVASKSGHDR